MAFDDGSNPMLPDTVNPEIERVLEDRQQEKKLSEATQEAQFGTPIPALYNQFYKFIQNPSTVSVDTFKRMIDTDDTLGSGVDFLQICLAARIGPYLHPNPEITDWVNKALNRIKGGFYSNLKASTDSAWAGFSVQEKVWANDPELGFVIHELPSLPASTILFEAERNGKLTPMGILQYQRGAGGGSYGFGYGSQNGFLGAGIFGSPDPWAKFGDLPYPVRTGNTWSYMSVRIPVEKCLHVAFKSPGQYGNPYGRSLLRRAYKWWVVKDAVLRMLSVALDRKGTPLTVIFADGAASVIDGNKQQKQGNTARGNNTNSRTAAQAAGDAFANVHNDSVIVLPGRKDQVYSIQELGRGSNADDFLATITLCNASMMRALLVPSLVMTNGDGTGSYALGQEHARTFDKIMDGMLDCIKEAWLEHVVHQLLMYNWPESTWRKDGLGEFTKRELSQEEREKEMGIIEKAVSTGAIDHTDLDDLNQTRDKLGYAPRTTPIITEREEEVTDGNKDDGGDEKNSDPDKDKEEE